MQVGVDVKCMDINFGGHCLSGFRDIATFKIGQNPFETMDYRAQTGKFRGILFFFLVCYHECLALLPESIVNTTRLHNNTICLFKLTSTQEIP